MAKHTPVPWWTMPDPSEDVHIIAQVGEGTPLAKVAMSEGTIDGEGGANAEFIVRACNNHERLLAACKKAREALFAAEGGVDKGNELIDACEECDYAIAQATGRTA